MRSQTDERLRYYLNANQGARERLVADLLPQLGPYANCKPRRPEGGPDSGVDMVAGLHNEGRVLVAVGFKNDAGPPSTDRGWVRRKFTVDLAGAKASGIEAIGFVFVTNVDLAPATRSELKQKAVDQGFVHAELYDREQLRLALDRPEGYFLRLRYLDIPMTTEEQYRLLATVGTELGHLAVTVQSIEQEVQRSNLHRAFDSRVRSIGWTFCLADWREIRGKGHALLLAVPGLPEAEPSLALVQEIEIKSDDAAISTKTSAWKQSMGEEAQLVGAGTMRWRVASEEIPIHLIMDWPFDEQPTVHGFLRYGFRAFATAGIADFITSMTLAVNDLTVVDSEVPSPYVFPATAQPRWPEVTPPRFATTEWTALAVDLSSEIIKALRPLPPGPSERGRSAAKGFPDKRVNLARLARRRSAMR